MPMGLVIDRAAHDMEALRELSRVSVSLAEQAAMMATGSDARALAAEERAQAAEQKALEAKAKANATEANVNQTSAQMGERMVVIEEMAVNYRAVAEESVTDRAGLTERVTNLEGAQTELDRQLRTLPELTLLANETEEAITWRKPFSDTSYDVRPSVFQSGALLGSVSVTEKENTKSEAGVTLTVKTVGVGLAAGATLDVVAFREVPEEV